MNNYLYETIYNGEHYLIPSHKMDSWYAYMKDLSIYVKYIGNLQTEFHDAFDKFKKNKKNEQDKYSLAAISRCNIVVAGHPNDWQHELVIRLNKIISRNYQEPPQARYDHAEIQEIKNRLKQTT